jgi:hypothetical protein
MADERQTTDPNASLASAITAFVSTVWGKIVAILAAVSLILGIALEVQSFVRGSYEITTAKNNAETSSTLSRPMEDISPSQDSRSNISRKMPKARVTLAGIIVDMIILAVASLSGLVALVYLFNVELRKQLQENPAGWIIGIVAVVTNVYVASRNLGFDENSWTSSFIAHAALALFGLGAVVVAFALKKTTTEVA